MDTLLNNNNSTVLSDPPCQQPQEPDDVKLKEGILYLDEPKLLDWHGAPQFNNSEEPRALRQEIRAGRFTNTTNNYCKGFLQCNLVVLHKEHALDFMVFCQRNKQACPLIEVCDVGSPFPEGVAAQGADLRTDVPK